MKKITTNADKRKLVEKLLKNKEIDFSEALMLLEEEIEVHYTGYPYWYQISPQPVISFNTPPQIEFTTSSTTDAVFKVAN